MKSIKKLIPYSICIMLACVSCDNKVSETYEGGAYKNMATMLNKCKGTTVVTGISEMAGSMSHAEIGILVIDSTNTAYMCRTGGDLGLHVGDTVKYAR